MTGDRTLYTLYYKRYVDKFLFQVFMDLYITYVSDLNLTIRLRARVFYEQIVNEAQLSLVENEGE